MNTTVLEDRKEQASNTIIHALGDHALRIVRVVTGAPWEMMAKLDNRYDLRTTATRISTMAELVTVMYCTVRGDMSNHIDRLAALIEKL